MKTLSYYREQASRLMVGIYNQSFLWLLLARVMILCFLSILVIFIFFEAQLLIIIMCVITLLFSMMILYGQESYYIDITYNQKPNFNRFFQAFTDGPMHVFILLLMKEIYTSLFSILLIIPGIIKHYELSMTSYIKIKHPHLTMKEIFNQSKNATDGYKKDLFLLDLRYFCYGCLSILTLGILFIKFFPEYKVSKILIFDDLLNQKDHIA